MRQAHRLQLRGQPQLDRNNRSSVFPINPAKGAVISTVLSLPQSCQTNVGITVISAGLCAENATGPPPWRMIWPPNLLQLALPAIFPLVHIRSVYRPDRSNFDSPCQLFDEAARRTQNFVSVGKPLSFNAPCQAAHRSAQSTQTSYGMHVDVSVV